MEEEYVQQNADYDREMEVPFLSGCFMLLNLEAVRVTGLFDEHFFLYFEDADMCRRLENAGFRNVYNPGVSIWHEYQKGAAHSFMLAKEALVSAMYYFRKWGWG